MESPRVYRKCAGCGRGMEIRADGIGSVVCRDGKTYHEECFKKTCRARMQSGDGKEAVMWAAALGSIDDLKKETRESLLDALARDGIYRILSDEYGLVNVPPYVWKKLASVYDGTYKGMSCRIPPEHLLDMWRRKLPYLREVAARNEAKGREFDDAQRAMYDLAVLVGKYGGYLKWLERQKALAAERDAGSAVPDGILEQAGIGNPARPAADAGGGRAEGRPDISKMVDDVFKL